MSIPYDKALISKARSLRKQATPQENLLWYQFLRAYPIRFQRQKAIGEYIVDFYCHRAKLVVEIDGSQHYEKIEQEKDAKRTAALEQFGLQVIRFSNREVNRQFDAVCEAIDLAVKTQLRQTEYSSLGEGAVGEAD